MFLNVGLDLFYIFVLEIVGLLAICFCILVCFVIQIVVFNACIGLCVVFCICEDVSKIVLNIFRKMSQKCEQFRTNFLFVICCDLGGPKRSPHPHPHPGEKIF